MSPSDINRVTHEILEKERENLGRVSLLGERLSYYDNSDEKIDGNESAREFLDTIEDFISSKTNDVTFARQRARELSWTISQSSSQKAADKGM